MRWLKGYAPVRSLVLDQDRAWQELFRVIPGFESYPPTELDLLKWSGDAQRRESFTGLENMARHETVQRLREMLGDLVTFVFAAIDTGSADDLLEQQVALCQQTQWLPRRLRPGRSARSFRNLSLWRQSGRWLGHSGRNRTRLVADVNRLKFRIEGKRLPYR